MTNNGRSFAKDTDLYEFQIKVYSGTGFQNVDYRLQRNTAGHYCVNRYVS